MSLRTSKIKRSFMLIECDARLQAGWDEARVTHSVKGKRMSLAVPLGMRLSGVPRNQDAGLHGHSPRQNAPRPLRILGQSAQGDFYTLCGAEPAFQFVLQ